MKFGTIVLLLFMCISIHHVLVYSSECRRTIQMLHGRISWLDSANNRLTRKLKEKKGLAILKLLVLSLSYLLFTVEWYTQLRMCAYALIVLDSHLNYGHISSFVVEANPGKHLKFTILLKFREPLPYLCL